VWALSGENSLTDRVLLLQLKRAVEGTMMTDLQRLTEKYRKEITQLEAHIAELKRKQNILVQASRLLEEELLTPHRTLYEKLSDASREKDQKSGQL
jgi:uncharacterized protein YbgA (DUF1722 family)